MSPERAAQRPLELIHANLSGQRLRSLKYVAPRLGIITEARMTTAEYTGDEMTALAQMLINGVTDNRNADTRAGAVHLLRAVDFGKVDILRIGKVYSLAINRLLQHPEATTDLANATLHLAPYLAQAPHLAEEAKEKWMALSRETSSLSQSGVDAQKTALPILLLSSVQINPQLARILRNIVILAKEQRKTKTQIATQLGLPMKDIEDYVSALVDTSGLDLSPEQEKPISEQELSKFLASVGNHEGKALLLAFMEKDSTYSMTELFQFINGMNGNVSRREVESWCTKSLVEGGMVARIQSGDSREIRYSKTEQGETLGDALAGYLLSLSFGHQDVSLYHLFGSNSAEFPLTRVRIFSELIKASNLPMTRGVLIKALLADYPGAYDHFSKDSSVLDGHLETLARQGVITYETRGNSDSYIYYKSTGTMLQEDLPVPKNDRTFTHLVYRVLSDSHSSELTMEGIYEALCNVDAEYRELSRDTTLKRIDKALAFLKSNELVQSEGRDGFTKDERSRITLSDEQRRVLVEVVATIDGFVDADKGFLDEGIRRAKQIITSQDACRYLLQKAKDVTPKTSGEIDNRSEILALVTAQAGISSREIYNLLDKKISLITVKAILAELRKKGQIVAEERKGAFYYSVPVGEPEDSSDEVVFDD